tara:strand:+ start:341 stop:1000 length:660 start_codon:yes stop_codon:yes gene_type:complete
MKTTTLHVYIMFAEMRGIYDKMNVKIGVSDNPKKRLKGVQTGCPGDVHLIRTFEAGQDAFIHEGHFHKLYEDFSTGGEWFEFDNDHFVEKVLPEMIEYFGKIEIRYDKKETTTFSLGKLLQDVDCAKFEINNGLVDDYTNRKIIQIKLKKAQTLVNDTEKVKFQNIIDEIQNILDEECKQKRKDDQEKLAIKNLKRKAYVAQNQLNSFAMGVLVGMDMR